MRDELPETTPKPFVFVLMPFESAFDDIYKFGIKGAADDAGAYAERVDEQIFTEGILERIFNQINKADVIIADMTGRNPNVFYEVGYAHALGKIVLLLTKDTADIPFDLKQRQHTVYGGKIGRLRQELAPRIKWAIQEASHGRGGPGGDALRISVAGVELPRIQVGPNTPTVVAVTPGSVADLPMCVQNLGPDVSENVSHVYMLGRPDARVFPYEQYDAVVYTAHGKEYRDRIRAIPPVADSIEESSDGLTCMRKLDLEIDSLPVKAVEQFALPMMLGEGSNEVKELVKLRLHTAYAHYDYPFWLDVRMEEKQK